MDIPLDGDFEVRASGGVLLRSAPQRENELGENELGDDVVGDEVFVVHRPRYDDWSLPKGKLDPGETDEECALREVLEETGFECTLGAEVARITYDDNKGRSKLVRYWLMTITGGDFEVNDEVDEARWVALSEARPLLTYDRDRDVLDQVTAHRASES